MVHQYQLNGYNIVLDTCSGSVHTVDEVAYDVIAMYERATEDEIVAAMLKKYAHLDDVNEDEIREALATNIPDRIMLDNFSPERTKGAVEIIRTWEKENGRHIEIESSGGITIDTIRSYAETGVDFVSVGALTHSIKSLDMSFKAVKA